MGRAAGQVHAAAADVDEEQHVQPLEPDGVDSEEIRCNDALRLRVQELRPRWAPARTCWTELFLAQDFLDRRRRYDDAEASQLAHNPLIAPPRNSPELNERSALDGSLAIDGGPGRCASVQRFTTIRRCHRRRVAGLTRNTD